MHRLFKLASLGLLAVSVAAMAQDNPAPPISAEEKASALKALMKDFQENYVFPDLATQANAMLQKHIDAHDYDSITNGRQFARTVSEQLREICKDAHLHLGYSPEPLPVRKEDDKPLPDEIAKSKTVDRVLNGGYEKVERLQGNIGYLEVRGFLPREAAEKPARAAMDFLANTDALIIDIRRNGGGEPDTVRLLCSYLFDATPVHLNDIYFRQGNRTKQFWTSKNVPGSRYANKPVFVLTSKRTGSGAEEFAYDLQSLHRATIVGESTWGGANPGGFYRLTDHFEAFIPTGRAINPYTKANWEGTGVKPDVAVSAPDALMTARKLAIQTLLASKNSSDFDQKARLQEALKALDSAPRG